ncbi:SURF1 family protein [Legionella geestiana]|uniref:SURF1-like protein n=1 Tax=Legionella geestiana TaxID=45065 RepID=A0A0W0TUB7_9GAMM|nr:SURF1 family protein [Legionella geestiana]KTC98954.1 SURF1 family protein [Legionella geestiana]QBS13043.1 SURF1 family protein [Legionella geestiana]STX54444.1 Uncharacterized conserved protein [Legionella geestiana]
MVSVSFFRTRFTRDAWLLVVALAVFALLVRLGIWQLARADEKERIEAAQAHAQVQTPALWAPDDAAPSQFAPFSVSGHFLPPVFLLDNQHHQHQFGYRVLSPFQAEGGNILLVDRGWVPGDVSRKTFPQVKTALHMRTVEGYAWYPSPKQWVLGAAVESVADGKVTLLEREDPALVSELLHKSVYPFIMRQNPAESGGFVREWPVVSMPPARHRAYALQWFGLALVVPFVCFGLLCKKKS